MAKTLTPVSCLHLCADCRLLPLWKTLQKWRAFDLATDFSLSLFIFLFGLAVARHLKMKKRELQAAVPFLPGRWLWSWGPLVARCWVSGTDRVPSLALHLAHHVCVS